MYVLLGSIFSLPFTINFPPTSSSKIGPQIFLPTQYEAFGKPKSAGIKAKIVHKSVCVIISID